MDTHEHHTAPTQRHVPAAPDALMPPLQPALLDEPLEFILADHLRQRSVLAHLRRFAEAGAIGAHEAHALSAYLGGEIAHHHADEEDGLFPMLRRRALPSDELQPVLARLEQDHAASEAQRVDMLAVLAEAPAEGELALDGCMRRAFLAFAASEHRHLAVENAIVMAIARIRLTRADLRALSAGMKQRRGITA